MISGIYTVKADIIFISYYRATHDVHILHIDFIILSLIRFAFTYWCVWFRRQFTFHYSLLLLSKNKRASYLYIRIVAIENRRVRHQCRIMRLHMAMHISILYHFIAWLSFIINNNDSITLGKHDIWWLTERRLSRYDEIHLHDDFSIKKWWRCYLLSPYAAAAIYFS